MDVARQVHDDPLFFWRSQVSCSPAAAQVKIICTVPAGVAFEDPEDRSDLDIVVPREFTAIWSVLERHRGQEAAITAPAIADAAGLWGDVAPANRGTRVRKVLELAQEIWPWPLCGDGDGFYLAATAEEISHAFAALTSRARKIFIRRRSLDRAARRVGFQTAGKGRYIERKEVMPIARA